MPEKFTILSRDVLCGYKDSSKYPFKINIDGNGQFIPSTEKYNANDKFFSEQNTINDEKATTIIFYGSEAEPSLAVNPINPKKIVTAWQEHRISNGGALEIGISYSNDTGKTWNHSYINVQRNNNPDGFIQRISDVWLRYSYSKKDLFKQRLFLNVYFFNNNNLDLTSIENNSGMVVFYSDDDGKTWSNPTFLIRSKNLKSKENIQNSTQYASDDKETLTCNHIYTNNIYCVWDRFPSSNSYHSDTYFAYSNDNGNTWLPPKLIYNPSYDTTIDNDYIVTNNTTINNEIIVLSNGYLLNFMVRFYNNKTDIAFIKSTDNGNTWSTTATRVAYIEDNPTKTINTQDIIDTSRIRGNFIFRDGSTTPSYAINKNNNNLYVAYQKQIQNTIDSKIYYHTSIQLNYSKDKGNTWNNIQINETKLDLSYNAYSPTVCVNENGYVAVMFCDNRNSTQTLSLTDIWLRIYKETTNELLFKKELRLTPNSYIAEYGCQTSKGIMTNGDYSDLQYSNNNFYAVYTRTDITSQDNLPFIKYNYKRDNTKQDFPLNTNITGVNANKTIVIDTISRQKTYVSVISVTQ